MLSRQTVLAGLAVMAVFQIAPRASAQQTAQADLTPFEALLTPKAPPGCRLAFGHNQSFGQDRWQTYLLHQLPALTDADVAETEVRICHHTHERSVNIAFTAAGSKAFESFTAAHVRQRLAIVLDGEVLSAPLIMERISGGRAQINLGSGGPHRKRLAEADRLAVILRTSSLPTPLIRLRELTTPDGLQLEVALDMAAMHRRWNEDLAAALHEGLQGTGQKGFQVQANPAGEGVRITLESARATAALASGLTAMPLPIQVRSDPSDPTRIRAGWSQTMRTRLEADAMVQTRAILERRQESMNLGDHPPSIGPKGRIVLRLEGPIKDRDAITDLLSRGRLEFCALNDESDFALSYKQRLPEGIQLGVHTYEGPGHKPVSSTFFQASGPEARKTLEDFILNLPEIQHILTEGGADQATTHKVIQLVRKGLNPDTYGQVQTLVRKVLEPPQSAPAALVAGLVGGAAAYLRVTLPDAKQADLLAGQITEQMLDPTERGVIGLLVEKGVLGPGKQLLVAHAVFTPADRKRLSRLLAQDYTHIKPLAILKHHWPPAYRGVYTLASSAPDRALELLLAESHKAGWQAVRLADRATVRKLFPGTSADTLAKLSATGVVAVAGQTGDPHWLAAARLGPGRLSVEVLISEFPGPLGNDLAVLLSELPPASPVQIARLAATGFWDGDAAAYLDPLSGLVKAQWTAFTMSRAAVSYGDGPEKLKLLDQANRETKAISRWGMVKPRAFVDFNARAWFEADKTRMDLRWMTTPAGKAAFAGLALPTRLTPAHLQDPSWLEPIRKALMQRLPSAGPLADGQFWPMDHVVLHHWPLLLAHGQAVLEGRRVPAMVRQLSPALFGAPDDETGHRTIGLEHTEDAIVMHIVHTPSAPDAIQRRRADECIQGMEALAYADPYEKEVLFAKSCQPGCDYSYADGPGDRSRILQADDSARPCDRFCSPDALRAFSQAPLNEAWGAAYTACGQNEYGLSVAQAHLFSSEWALIQRTSRWLGQLKKRKILDQGLSERLAKASELVRFGLPFPATVDKLYRLPSADKSMERSNQARLALIVSPRSLRLWPAPRVVMTAGGARADSVVTDGQPGSPIELNGLAAGLAKATSTKNVKAGYSKPADLIRRAKQAGLWLLVDREVPASRLPPLLAKLSAPGGFLGVLGNDGTTAGHAVLLAARAIPRPMSIKLTLGRNRIGVQVTGKSKVYIKRAVIAEALPRALGKGQPKPRAASLKLVHDLTTDDLVSIMDVLAAAGVRVISLDTAD